MSRTRHITQDQLDEGASPRRKRSRSKSRLTKHTLHGDAYYSLTTRPSNLGGQSPVTRGNFDRKRREKQALEKKIGRRKERRRLNKMVTDE